MASRLLPSGRQRGVVATYAWCRLADDIVDRADAEGPEAMSRQLEAWERQLEQPSHPVAIAFASTRCRYGVDLAPARDLLAGLRMDLEPGRYATWLELQTYCYHVAGTVGLLVAPILGCEDSAAHIHAARLGIAMQLTNILRDVAEDAAMGRLYLPLDEIDAFGCDPDAILAGEPGPGFADLIAFQIGRARDLYASALQGVTALAPSGQFATMAAANLYAGILDEIERSGYDVFRGRAVVSSPRRLRSVARASASVVRLSLPVGHRAAETAPADRQIAAEPGPATYRVSR
jgi:phytoene synthase